MLAYVKEDPVIQNILAKIKAEPVLARTLVGAAAVLLVQCGVPFPDKLADAISGLIVAVAALSTRAKVSPVEH